MKEDESFFSVKDALPTLKLTASDLREQLDSASKWACEFVIKFISELPSFKDFLLLLRKIQTSNFDHTILSQYYLKIKK